MRKIDSLGIIGYDRTDETPEFHNNEITAAAYDSCKLLMTIFLDSVSP